MGRRADWRKRVVADSSIHHKEACIRGTRIPAAVIVGSLADRMSFEEILEEYPQLPLEDIRAALAYAAEALQEEVILPLA